MNRVVITYNSFDGAAAAALLLRRWPEARLQISSEKSLPHTLQSISVEPDDEIHLVGFPAGENVDELGQALEQLKSAGARVVWYLPGPRRGQASLLAAYCEIVSRRSSTVTKVVADHLGAQDDHARKLARIAVQESRKRRPDDTLYLLFDAAVTRFFQLDDYDAVPNAIRKLANLSPIDARDEENMEIYRRLGAGRLTGKSRLIRELRRRIEKVGADSHCRVLITGETGTGKEVAARLIHQASQRCRGPFISVNCATFEENLLESQLFGHEEGAFTGATRRHIGFFEKASAGTLFLDEIAEMPLRVQAKLLRALQEGAFTRLGGAELIRVDVRVVAATNQDLEEKVRQGDFRADLFYRLNVISLRMPALREHPEDIPEIASEILYSLAERRRVEPPKLNKKQLRVLQSYSWPGNVRELQNVLERAFVLDEWDMNELLDSSGPMREVPDIEPLATHRRRYVRQVYERLGRNITRTAEALDVTRNTLKKILREAEGSH